MMGRRPSAFSAEFKESLGVRRRAVVSFRRVRRIRHNRCHNFMVT